MDDSIWWLCSTYANVLDSSAYAQAEGVHFNGGRGASYNIIQHPMHSTLFQLFITGLEQHMGQDVRPNVGLDYKILHGSLWGNKGFRMEIQGLLEHINQGQDEPTELNHVVLPLLGKLKGEHGKRWHLLLIAEDTTSGGKREGAVIYNKDSALIPSPRIEKEFHMKLLHIQETHPQVALVWIPIRSNRSGNGSFHPRFAKQMVIN
eukprot:15328118-Ditylum_brightwellii.AAC.1